MKGRNTMMRTSAFLLALALPIATTSGGCAGPTEAEVEAETTNSGESAASSVRWEAVYRCDDGSTLDVNVDERREVQLVVRNAAAKKHLLRSADVSFFDWDISSAGEILYRGRVDRGIFYARDFTSAKVTSGRAKDPVLNPYPPTALVTRSGSDITVVANDYYNWTFRNCR